MKAATITKYVENVMFATVQAMMAIMIKIILQDNTTWMDTVTVHAHQLSKQSIKWITRHGADN